MAFIGKTLNGKNYTPGWFLADNENCTRITKNFAESDSTNLEITTASDGTKYVPVGSIYKDVGIVYEDVDLSKTEAAGSVVISGTVYKDRLTETAKASEDLANLTGIKVIEESPSISRPDEFNIE